jgi:signal peptidase II
LKRLRGDDLTTLAVLGAVVLIDQCTKAWALDRFRFEPRHVVWTLRLVVAHNTGTAFSLLSGRGVGPIVALLAVVVVVVAVRSLRMVQGRTAALACGLVVGGAVGNLADRAFRGDAGFLQGAVVDWIDFQWWPVFNVADAAICVGAVLLGIVAVFAPEPEVESDPGDDGSAGDPGRATWGSRARCPKRSPGSDSTAW